MRAWLVPCLLLTLAACTGKTPSGDDSDGADNGHDMDSEGQDSNPDSSPGTDADADGWTEDVDCNDNDSSIHPNATEICDELDNDCDGTADDGVSSIYYADADHDGWGDPQTAATGCMPEGAYSEQAGDCDDTNVDRNPAADEFCDNVDNDCDGMVDEDAAPVPWFLDGDGDGWGAGSDYVLSCEPVAGRSSQFGDCDDTRNDVNPDETEVCDLLDNNCDGRIDEGVEASPWFPDGDGDGYGTASEYVIACNDPGGYSAFATDCDDTTVDVYPGAPEVCDGLDNDCDGERDEDATGASTWYYDGDRDGYGGTSGASAVSCDQPAGYVSDHSDCDDAAAESHPGADEVCDDADNDCDGYVDDNVEDGDIWYVDADRDGFGDPTEEAVVACEPGAGYASNDLDCDDSTSAISPTAAEVCNHVDDNCDGEVDGTGLDGTFYADHDSDGYGDPTEWLYTCDPPAGYVIDGTDCDDADASIHPTADDVVGDGIDQNCDGALEYDLDGDGYEAEEFGGTDCDDDRADVHPGATDAPYDGFDMDCSGGSDYDADGDGYVSDAYGGDDCDDHDDTVYPGAPEINSIEDHDCDGVLEYGPTADASYDATSSNLLSCSPLYLDGSASRDREGSALTYAWEVTEAPYGSSVSTTSLVEESDESPYVFVDEAGDYEFTLQVTDADGNNSAIDTLAVSVEPRTSNTTPVAAATGDAAYSGSANCNPVSYGAGGYDCDPCPAMSLTLDGSGSYDSDDEPLSYQWTVYSGDAVLISDPTASSVSLQVNPVTAGYPSAVTETVVVRLEVTDCYGATSAPDPVTITYTCSGY